MDSLKINGSRIADKIWNSKLYLPAILSVSLIGQITHTNIAAMAVLAALSVFMLIMCDDLLSIACPVLCVIVLSVEYYKDYTALTPYAPYAAVPFALALIFNVIYYRRPFYAGKFLQPLAAVSAALLLGGVGIISVQEYFRPVSLYYVLGLGVVQLLLYMLVTSRLQNERGYDRIERLADILFVTGVTAAAVIIIFYIENFDEFLDKGTALFFKPRNFISSVLLMTLPSACLLIKRRIIHFTGFILMSLALIFAGSRSGLLFGAMVGFACTIYIVSFLRERFDPHKWYQWVFIAITALLFAFAFKYIPLLYRSRLVHGSFVSSGETRVSFIELGIMDFLENPINGVGLGNLRNLDVFKAIIPGSIVFYHNEVIQILASMGFIGVIGYGWLFIKRAKLMISSHRTKLIVFSIAYCGILAMSMVNPGLFCPVPEAALTVLLFAVMEKESPPNR